MDVNVFDVQSDLKIEEKSVKPVVESVLQIEIRTTDEVAVHFVSTEEICRLHEQFFGDPSPTDCISLPLDREEKTPYHTLGEIFICPNTALEYAKKHAIDRYEELTLYLVHGLLHLIGYDDVNDIDEVKMREAEARHMEVLGRQKLFLSG